MDTLQWLWNLLLLVATVCALRYDPAQIEHNMNTNQTANGDVLNYWGEWQNHTFTPSPSNWRIPFYTILLDRFANGDPTNDNANGTQFEHDMTQTQLRHGGDMRGLQDSLDYLQGMGIKVGPKNCPSKEDTWLTSSRRYTWQVAPILTFRGLLIVTALLTLRCWIIISEPYLNGRQQSQTSINEECT